MPYFATATMVVAIIDGIQEFSFYFGWILIALIGFLIKISFHNFSTSVSHVTTFRVISEIRVAVSDKLRKVPLPTKSFPMRVKTPLFLRSIG